MVPTLYVFPPSAPVMSVQITAKALGIQLKEKNIDLTQKEQLNPDFLKVNPQHTVPTLVEEDGFSIWDSHAINIYLVSKYGKNNSLYPKDLKKRAVVDQRLHFNSGVVRPTGVKIKRSIFATQRNSLEDSEKEELNKVYEFLEAFLNNAWIAGDSVTIADYNIFTTTAMNNLLHPIDVNKFPKLAAWFKKVDALPEIDVCRNGLIMAESIIKNKLTK